MAFVINRSPKRSVFENENDIPGPGQYQRKQRQLRESVAPFHSSTYKISTFDVESTKYGPGYYNPIDQKNLLSQKKLAMSSSFVSKVQRFRSEGDENRNHSYLKQRSLDQQKHDLSYKEQISKAKQKMSNLQKQNRKRGVQSIKVDREYVRIVLSNPHNTEMMQSVYIDKSITKKQNGPGSYELNRKPLKQRKSAGDWSRSHQKRFKHKKSETPGPGSYEYPPEFHHKSANLSSSFSYSGVRSHIEELIYKTKIPFKIQIIQEKNLKDRFPGPGTYEPKGIGSNSFHYGEQHFGSKIDKVVQPENKTEAPGPGYYNFYNQRKNMKKTADQLKQTRQKIFKKHTPHHQTVKTLQELNKEEVIKFVAEREAIQTNFYSLKERCRSKTGTIAQQERFKGSEMCGKKLKDGPGPGQYYRPMNLTVDQKGYKSVFKSTTDRMSFGDHAIDVPFYEINRHDIGKKAAKMKKIIENLKQIDIVRAPFNSNQPRMELQKMNKSQLNQNLSHQIIPQQQTFNKKSHSNKKSKQFQQSSAFKSKSKRDMGITGMNEVGPGEYQCGKNLQKRSFNLQYNYLAPSKIRPAFRTHSSLT